VETQQSYDIVIAKAKNEAHELFQEGKRDAEAKKADMMEAAKQDVAKMIENGKKTLETKR